MPRPSESPLTDPEWAVLETRADRFHDAWRKGPVADWTPYLDGLTPRVRKEVLTELVLIDLGQRFARGDYAAAVEEYLSRFPDLGPRDDVPSKVIVEEFRLRKKHNRKPDSDSYRVRFPMQFPSIRHDLEGPANIGESLAADTSIGFDKGGGTVAGTIDAPPEMPGGGTAFTSQVPIGKLSDIKALASGAPSGMQLPAPESAMLAVSHNYELIKVLGSGSFADVWLARKQPSGIEVAVKIIKQPIDRSSAQRELGSLELIKNFRHPYLLATLDYWVSDAKLHIVMELADGTMKSRLKQCEEVGHPGIPREELIDYFAEAAQGLDYLHARSIMHRDVKPDNILLLNGHVKVADFGLARQQDEIMATTSFAGTPIYMAPEVWGGKGGPASDLYSLAFAYIELRQGKSPIKPGPFADVMMAHIEGQFDLSDDIPEEEQEVLRRALLKEPSERYTSCAEFMVELGRACGVDVRIRVQTRGGGGSFPTIPSAPELGTPSGNRETQGGRQAGTIAGGLTKKQSSGLKAKPGTQRTPALAQKPQRGSKMTLIGLLVLVGGVGFAAAAVVLKGGKDPAPSTEVAPPTDPSKPPPTVDEPPPMREPWLPTGANPDTGAKLVVHPSGRPVYDRIQFTPSGAQANPARFVLIPGTRSVPAFYLQETKVWNALYAGYAEDRSLPAPSGGAFVPTTGLTAMEAEQFAQVLFGGTLPTPAQWDQAAGVDDRHGWPGPTAPGTEAKVNRANPAPIFPISKDADRSTFGIYDMAGNGREWTRQVLKPAGFVEVDKTPADALVVLRGRSFTLRLPLTFKILDEEQKVPQTQFAGKGSPYTGFRVAIPISPK